MGMRRNGFPDMLKSNDGLLELHSPEDVLREVAQPPDLYGKVFYESHREGSARSAAIVAPVLMDLLRPRSIVDVGCGDGLWLAAFHDQGVEDLVGVDGAWAAPHWQPRSGISFLERDLAGPIELNRRFDLALCLEVAEHLPHEAAELLITELAQLSSVVVFSAAIPYQGGEGHLNEQWASYWSAHFAAQDFECAANLRWRFWADERVMFWYRQNLLCFVARRERALIQRLREAESAWMSEPKDVVHPELFLLRCRDLEQKTAHAERIADACARRDEEIARATGDLAHLRETFDRTQSELGQARDELRDARGDLHQALGKLGETQDELGRTRDELSKARGELVEARGELLVERGRAGQLGEELEQIKKSRSWRFVERMWRARIFLRLP